MCGIVGVFGLGCGIGIDDRTLCRMRDTMTRRGPDDAGLWRGVWSALGHRRLSVIDLSDAGHQPMVSPDGRHVLVYNGELYNDAALRNELSDRWSFRSSCDSETVLAALSVWGQEGIDRLRGMFAIGFFDLERKRVVLARDPLGIKPLYTARVRDAAGTQVVFASEPTALLEHPSLSPKPDWGVVSGYLGTLRTTLGSRTMFEGIETLEPGEIRLYDATGSATHTRRDLGVEPDPSSDARSTRSVIEGSVRAHERSDVPVCVLLSGGLDSAAIAHTVRSGYSGVLRTYCAGARLPGFDEDLRHAREMARVLGVEHTEVEIDQSGFLDRWMWMVSELGVPMSTPNEVAIYEVAHALRDGGHVVAFSGEGADELFGGYETPMREAAAHVRSLEGRPDSDGGLFHLRSNAWIGRDLKPTVLTEDAWKLADHDAGLECWYQEVFRSLGGAANDGGLGTHLRFQRRMNLPNLLRRLDTATMLASVEGRTPFADIEVARHAEGLGMESKFVDGDPARTKIAVRDAFADVLPESVVGRAKASFPLPFQSWAGELSGILRAGEFARTAFRPEAIEAVCAAPAPLWNLAWPMINVALWGERWWGRGRHELAPENDRAARV